MDLITPFLKLFFHLIYNRLAWIYDFVSRTVSGGRWNSWVLSVVPFIQGPAVLELGFGPGHLLAALAQSGLKVVGMDASRQMSRLAKRRLSQQKLPAALVTGYGEYLPFCEGCFNSVAATFPTAYILQPATLENIFRILAPGGRLVILLSAWIIDPSLSGRGLAWLFRVTGQELPQQFDVQNLLLRFQTAGFQAYPEWTSLPGSKLFFIIAERK